MFRILTCALLVSALSLPSSPATAAPAAQVAADDPLDPAHNVALPCEALGTPGLLPRSAKNIAHVANVCGFVGTDVEFQSRVDASGAVRDYAFVGTMGAGLRIFDITDPAHPSSAGAYVDSGWQGDVQVRGDVALVSFDPISSTAPTISACLQTKALETGSRTSGGVDIVRLTYDPATGNFATGLIGCVALNPAGGAHNATLHPSGEWIAVSNPRGHGSLDVIDLRGEPTFVYRVVQLATISNSACTSLPPPTRCVWNGRGGTWSPHDISFSKDGDTAYVAAVGNDTVLLDVTAVLNGEAPTLAVVPNDHDGDGAISATDGNDISISHQTDVSADGKILVITDERGGGLQNTSCNTDPDGVIGGAHFWRVDGTTPARLGAWFYPNPTLALDPLAPALAAIGRTERACTIHVLRNGGNGSAGPGPIQRGYDGVSDLPIRQLVVAHYGAGVWHLDFSGASSASDGIAEDARSTWANTLGWNVMPGAETWSAKEYKGFIYAGDMGRGFDVYAFANCDGLGCLTTTANTPGQATGGGKLTEELEILRGITAGGKASFGFDLSYATATVAPSGSFSFRDKAAGVDLEATAIDSFQAAAGRATITGRATVSGVPGVRFFLEVEDLADPGKGEDRFRLVLATGYGAAGVVKSGNIKVS